MGSVHAKEAMANEAASSDASIVSLQGVTAQVTKVFVDGVERTKEDVILRQVREVFKAQHFEDLLLRAQDCRNNLQGEEGGIKIKTPTFSIGLPCSPNLNLVL
jgi:tRNA A37 threonylcarbamoyladenosine dehydratase